MAGTGSASSRRRASQSGKTVLATRAEGPPTGKRRRGPGRGGRFPHSASLHARDAHEAEAAALTEGISQLEEYISKLNELREGGEPPTNGDARDWLAEDTVAAMTEVIDENPRPSLEYVLGVLGAAEVPKRLAERQRSQGARAFTAQLRNRAIRKKREAIEKKKREAAPKPPPPKPPARTSTRRGLADTAAAKTDAAVAKAAAAAVDTTADQLKLEVPSEIEVSGEQEGARKASSQKNATGMEAPGEAEPKAALEGVAGGSDVAVDDPSKKSSDVEEAEDSDKEPEKEDPESKPSVVVDPKPQLTSVGGDAKAETEAEPVMKEADLSSEIKAVASKAEPDDVNAPSAEDREGHTSPRSAEVDAKKTESEEQTERAGEDSNFKGEGDDTGNDADAMDTEKPQSPVPPKAAEEPLQQENPIALPKSTSPERSSKASSKAAAVEDRDSEDRNAVKDSAGKERKTEIAFDTSQTSLKAPKVEEDAKDPALEEHSVVSKPGNAGKADIVVDNGESRLSSSAPVAAADRTVSKSAPEPVKVSSTKPRKSHFSAAPEPRKEDENIKNAASNEKSVEKDRPGNSIAGSGLTSRKVAELDADKAAETADLKSEQKSETTRKEESRKDERKKPKQETVGPSEKKNLPSNRVPVVAAAAADDIIKMTRIPRKVPKARPAEERKEDAQHATLAKSAKSPRETLGSPKLKARSGSRARSRFRDLEEGDEIVKENKLEKKGHAPEKGHALEKARASVPSEPETDRQSKAEKTSAGETLDRKGGSKQAGEEDDEDAKEESREPRKPKKVWAEAASKDAHKASRKEAIESAKTRKTKEKEKPPERRVGSRRHSYFREDLIDRSAPQTRLRRESSHLRDPTSLPADSDPFIVDCFHVWKTINQDRITIPFRQPVTARDAPGYFDVVKEPMDLSTVRKQLEDKTISTPAEFYSKMLLICSNAMLFNDRSSDLYDLAVELRQKIKKGVKPVVKEWKESVAAAMKELGDGDTSNAAGSDDGSRRSKSPDQSASSPSESESSEDDGASEAVAQRGGVRHRARRTSRGGANAGKQTSTRGRKKKTTRGRGRGRGSSSAAASRRVEEEDSDDDEDDENVVVPVLRGRGGRGRRGVGGRRVSIAAAAVRKGKRGRPPADEERDDGRKRRRVSGRKRRDED